MNVSANPLFATWLRDVSPGAWALGEGLILSGEVRILDSDYATSDNTAVVQNSPPQITKIMLLPDVSYQNMVGAPPTLPK